jgi:hypothetical protein
MKPMVANITDVLPMVTDVFPMVVKESSIANPQKVAKIYEKMRKIEQTLVGNTVLDLKQLMNYPIPRLTLGISDTIGSIGYHRLSIGKHCWHLWETQCIFRHRQQSQHWRPDVIGTQSQCSN